MGAALVKLEMNRVVEVWPENVPSWRLFCDIDNQWRVGPGGPFALDYNVLRSELDDLSLTGEERQRMKADIYAMEQAALDAIHAK